MARGRLLCLALVICVGGACGGGSKESAAAATAQNQAAAPAANAAPAEAEASAYQPADVANDDVKAAASFAVAEQARRSGYTLTLGAIRRAELQNAVATNYRLCLDVDIEGGSDHVLAVVLRSQGQHTLTSWTPGACE